MGDPRRQFWNQGTKEQLFLVMEQVWLHVAPTSERIIEDLEHLPDVVKKVIAHGGAVVPDEVLRSGRRALSEADRKKVPTRKRNPSARDKISTQRAMIIHNDLQDAEGTLLGTGGDIDGDGDAGAAMDADETNCWVVIFELFFKLVNSRNKVGA